MTTSLQAPLRPGHRDRAGDRAAGHDDAPSGRLDDTGAALDAAVRRVLGPDASLRDIQADALRELETHDTLLVARSGAGKTAVYAIATLIAGRLTLVVSPLLALQRDQVDALRAA